MGEAKFKNLSFKPYEHHADFNINLKHKIIAKHTKGFNVDIGCGWYSNPYLINTVGVDLLTIDKPNNYIRMVKADCNKRLPFENETFDTVIASGIIEHLYDYIFFLQECYRIAKKDATLIFTTANKTINRLIARRNTLHYIEWSYSDFVDMLEHFYEIEKVYGLSIIVPLIRIHLTLEKFPRLSPEIIYICKKGNNNYFKFMHTQSKG